MHLSFLPNIVYLSQPVALLLFAQTHLNKFLPLELCKNVVFERLNLTVRCVMMTTTTAVRKANSTLDHRVKLPREASLTFCFCLCLAVR